MEFNIGEQLFAEVNRVYKEKGTLTNEILSALNFTFNGPLLPALDLLDNAKVTKFSSPSTRSVFQVLGSSGLPYICPSSANYCSCAAFKFSVLKKGDHFMCKHLLAIRLGTAMDTIKQQDISDQELCDVLQQLE